MDKNAELLKMLKQLVGGDEVSGVKDRAAYFINKNIREPLGAPKMALEAHEDDVLELPIPGSTERVRVARNDVSDEEWEEYKKQADHVVERTKGSAKGLPVVRTDEGGKLDHGVAMVGDAIDRHYGKPTPAAPGPTDPRGNATALAVGGGSGLLGAGKFAQDAMLQASLQAAPQELPADAPISERERTPEEFDKMLPYGPQAGRSVGVPENVAGVKMPDPAPPQDPALAGFSMSMQVPGAGLGPSGVPGVMKRIDEATKVEAKAIQSAADLEGQRLKRQGELTNQAIDQSLDAERKIAHVRQTRQAALEDYQKSYQSVVNKLNDPSMVVDPNRYWNDKGTGGKVLAAVSILLGGLGQGTFAALGIKKDNDALRIIQEAIRQDVEVQKTNIENKRAGLRDEAAGRRELYEMFRQEGQDEISAMRSEEAAKIDIVQRQIENLANEMGTAEAKAKADVLLAQLEKQKLSGPLMQGTQHVDNMAVQRAELGLKKFAISAKLAAAKANGGQPMRGQMADRITDLKNALGRAKDMSTEFKKSASNLLDKVWGLVPLTDAGKYDAKRTAAIQLIGKALEGGVLREGDMPRYEKMIAKAGDFATGEERWDFLIKELERDLGNTLDSYGRAGFNTGGYAGFSEDDIDTSDLEL